MPTEKRDIHYFITRVVNPDLNWIVVSLRSSQPVVYGRDGYTGLKWSDHSVSDRLASRLEEWRDNLWYEYKRDFPENGKKILDEFFEILVESEAKLSEDPNKREALHGLWRLAESMGDYLGLSEYVSQKAEKVKNRAAEIRERDRYLKEKAKEASASRESKTRPIPPHTITSPQRETNIKRMPPRKKEKNKPLPTKTRKTTPKQRVPEKRIKKPSTKKKSTTKTLAGWVVLLLVLAVGASWAFTGTPTQIIEDAVSEGRSLIDGAKSSLIDDEHGAEYSYATSPITGTFPYCLRGRKGEISLTLYGGVLEYMKNVPRTVYSNQQDEYWDIMVERLIGNRIQDEYLTPLVERIQSITDNPDDQLRIAVSLVQLIPYDWSTYSSSTTYMKSPYEVLYYNKGACAEKSFLLAYLLKKLGYGAVLLEYKAENHMAVAVKCPLQYANFQYGGAGYCFIEATRPTIITYIPDTYIGVGELKSTPHIIFVSDGREFAGVKEEYRDAEDYERLMELAHRNNNVLPQPEYQRWVYLTNKYCLHDN
ncbi:MAG: hypothetical protein J7L37_01495 [Thermococcus sp.]|nr:hypothetical protein [Thermococcus sp.]